MTRLRRCDAVVGPANNQLATPGVADLLHRRGVLWVPDYVASAGRGRPRRQRRGPPPLRRGGARPRRRHRAPPSPTCLTTADAQGPEPGTGGDRTGPAASGRRRPCRPIRGLARPSSGSSRRRGTWHLPRLCVVVGRHAPTAGIPAAARTGPARGRGRRRRT
ncbi:hypothetical protein LT493_16735 [Streptomyces tricolor]|nr:hypothetical protein [Streptomyces tricolor]